MPSLLYNALLCSTTRINRHWWMHFNFIRASAPCPKGKKRIGDAAEMIRFVVNFPLTQRAVTAQRNITRADAAQRHGAAAQFLTTIDMTGACIRFSQQFPPETMRAARNLSVKAARHLRL